MSTASGATPKCSALPRPSAPRTPRACASSTISHASYFSFRSTSLGRSATSPSIEYSPSTTISARPWGWRLAARIRSSDSRSLWRLAEVRVLGDARVRRPIGEYAGALAALVGFNHWLWLLGADGGDRLRNLSDSCPGIHASAHHHPIEGGLEIWSFWLVSAAVGRLVTPHEYPFTRICR